MGRSLSCARLIIAAVGSASLAASGCSPNLGAAPFKCSSAGQCPDGYECNSAKLCVKEGTCPAELPGCGATPAENCGDGACTAKETCEGCEKDCGKCGEPHCGDSKCEGAEDCKTCEADCGKCGAQGCGNGKCDTTETCESCEADCGKCSPACGDDKCGTTETCTNCPADCGSCNQPKCGNDTCDAGETCSSCAADCGACDKCGNDTCDAGETVASCPADCQTAAECAQGEAKCKDAENLTFCEEGKWQTDTCEALCKAGGFDYAVACRLAPSSGKEACICGRYATFGEICDDEVQCATDLFCGAFGATATAGYCTKYCSNPGGVCPGGEYGTEAQCILNVGGQDACGFICDFLTSCPTGTSCDLDDLCKPQ